MFCQLDPTSTPKMRAKRFNRAQLNNHLKGNRHTRRQQIIEAFQAVKTAGAAKVECPMCTGREYGTASKWLQHVAKYHKAELWSGESVDNKDEDTTILDEDEMEDEI
jgi:hypothetical protein